MFKLVICTFLLYIITLEAAPSGDSGTFKKGGGIKGSVFFKIHLHSPILLSLFSTKWKSSRCIRFYFEDMQVCERIHNVDIVW